MRLTKVTLWNYRSFWSPDTEGGQEETPSAIIDLSAGVNYITGPNNVGKSNLLRAIALALDPRGTTYNPDVDRPQGKSWGPAIELEFTTGPAPSAAVKRLLQDVEAYERTVEGFEEPSLASQGKICFYVGYWKGNWRDERFLTRATKDSGKVRGPNNKRQKAIDRFYELVRFVDIKSGEDLESLLKRGFKEILASAMGAELAREMTVAREARQAYEEALGRVLRPVGRHVEDRIKRYVRGIDEVDLVPNVPPVEDAIADARVFIKDAVRTALEQKGTGVRGAMLLLLLSFIADSAKSAVVFGIEEPEAFLHPEAHRELGAGLERFTQRSDVTLLVTTHSPFIFRPDAGASAGRSAVFVVRKDEEGRSSVTTGKPKEARTDLFGSAELSTLLETLEKVPEKAKLLLVVEGETDRDYLRLASDKLGIPLDDVHVLPRGGAAGAVLEAVALGAKYAPGRAVAALFDSDDTGNESFKLLSETFRWKQRAGERLHALSFKQWLDDTNIPVEAEDMFPNGALNVFLAEPGNDRYCTERVRRGKKWGTWHIGLDGDGKKALVQWLEQNGTPAMFEPWRPVLEHLRKLITDGAAKAK